MSAAMVDKNSFKDEDVEFNIDSMIKDMKDATDGEDDAISDFLNTPPVPYKRTIVPECEDKGLAENAEDDYRDVRQNLKQIIQDGADAVEGLSKVAKETESPRAYEVLAGYLKNMAEVNKQLIDLHKQKAEIDSERERANGGGNQPITNNNVFVGSTEELQRYLEAQKK